MDAANRSRQEELDRPGERNALPTERLWQAKADTVWGKDHKAELGLLLAMGLWLDSAEAQD